MRVRALGAARYGLAFALICSNAHADGKRDPTTAEALFAEGRRLMHLKDYKNACPRFADSEALDPAPGTALNLAACYEASEKFASAWSAYNTAQSLALTSGQQSRAAAAGKKASDLEPKLSKLTVQANVGAHADGLEIRVDGERLGAAELGLAIPHDGGDHTIDASAPGKAPWSKTVTLAAMSQSLTVEVPPLDAAPVAAHPAPAAFEASQAVAPAHAEEAPAPAGAPPASNPRRTIGVVLTGVGGAGLALGAVAGVLAISKHGQANSACDQQSTCPRSGDGPSLESQAATWGTVSTIGFIAGGVLAATGLTLYFTAPKAAPSSGSAASGATTPLSLAFTPSPQGFGATLQGGF